MNELSPEKIAAKEEADRRTDGERLRLESYLELRYIFSTCNVDYWLDTLYMQQKAIYKAQKKPSRNQVRKKAGIGFWENAFAFVSEEKKKDLDKKKAEVQKTLQEKVDKANAAEWERCSAYNSRLSERLRDKLSRLVACSPDEVEEYFTFALNLDSFDLDGSKYHLNFNLVYDANKRQLIIDYELPEMDKISRVKEWKVDKNNNVIPKEMNKADYLEMYERILFDISMRTVGVLFESDSNNVINSIVFNGSCLYNNWQAMPTILISFVIPKSQYSYRRISSMECVSKAEVAKLKEVRYLDDIHLLKAPADLWETPPSKLVVPIRSSFRQELE